mmetsp:Transcript_29579/g.48811  ORF Transcript_29579/g.48811 Transcript_29579/m.48811 type:complete len:261 (-) Transcript_29579:86-868(-)|eukprot:CAMPEP_0119011478 /NCGR_PEP_ID=MMETSP1176-20130426/5703_1 /TAXON_ID=265551 /ORGANISM="Synedropsis recta cf, Strain CCMP1620" /LENGTH=260 /DNA_ID=CAMNT_0006964317 /DNA_START=192 /DNA_END=974 /DNA_ORIENTATION=-
MDDVATEFSGDEFVSSKNKSITFDEARTLIGHAFTGTAMAPADPFSAWLNEPLPFKDETDRVFTGLFILGFPIYDHQKQGGIYLGERNADGKLISCILLKEYDPNAKSWFASCTSSWNSFLCFLHLRSVHGVPDLFAKSELGPHKTKLLSNVNNAEKQMAVFHKKHGPPVKHWYLVMVGVDPDCQAKGHGKKMMQRLHDLADARGVACYLECAGIKNPAFYGKLGYREVTEETLTDPSNETRSFTGKIMIREPGVSAAKK